jgi:hypothetical protein
MTSKYNLQYIPTAKEYLDSKGQNYKDKVEEKLELIKNKPYHFSRKKRDLRGTRAAQMGGDLRILFSICEECKRYGFESINICRRYCNIAGPNDIIICAIGTHKELRKLGY